MYVGDDEIIHLFATKDLIDPYQPTGTVYRETLTGYLYSLTLRQEKEESTIRWRINNYLDEKHEPFPLEEIIRRANSKV